MLHTRTSWGRIQVPSADVFESERSTVSARAVGLSFPRLPSPYERGRDHRIGPREGSALSCWTLPTSREQMQAFILMWQRVVRAIDSVPAEKVVVFQGERDLKYPGR